MDELLESLSPVSLTQRSLSLRARSPARGLIHGDLQAGGGAVAAGVPAAALPSGGHQDNATRMPWLVPPPSGASAGGGTVCPNVPARFPLKPELCREGLWDTQGCVKEPVQPLGWAALAGRSGSQRH